MNRADLMDRYRTGMDDLADALNGMQDEELDRPQEDGEWTVRQIVHHLADGEAMSYTRLCRLVADDPVVIQGMTNRASRSVFTTSVRSTPRLRSLPPFGLAPSR